MIMNDKKKNAAMLIIAKMKKPGQSDEYQSAPSEDGVEQDSSMGLKSACEEILQAVESKDPSALMSALDSYIQMRMDDKSEEESE